jgi:hypothetical protein
MSIQGQNWSGFDLMTLIFLVNFKHSPNATLRSAFSWKNVVKKIAKNNFIKNNFKKNNLIFFGYRGSTANLGCPYENLGCPCENLGCLGPLVLEEIENGQTVHKPKLKFIYRCFFQDK